MCLKQSYKMNEKYFFCANLVVLLWVEEKGGEMRDKERAALVPFVSDHKIRRWVREWLEDLNTERQVQKGFSPINCMKCLSNILVCFGLEKTLDL